MPIHPCILPASLYHLCVDYTHDHLSAGPLSVTTWIGSTASSVPLAPSSPPRAGGGSTATPSALLGLTRRPPLPCGLPIQRPGSERQWPLCWAVRERSWMSPFWSTSAGDLLRLYKVEIGEICQQAYLGLGHSGSFLVGARHWLAIDRGS